MEPKDAPSDALAAFLHLIYEEEDWRQQAACRGVDPNLFFPDKGQTGWSNAAKRICKGDPKAGVAPCPVRQQCFEYAVDNDEHCGIWGGESEKAFRAVRRTRREAA